MVCSIIIRAFNEEKYIGRLIKGIQNQLTNHEIEVILVDSGSTDRTVAIAKSMGVKVVSILPEEFSFGFALNKGCDSAKGDILLFASAHVYPVYANWVDKMLESFNDSKVALVYGRQVGYEGSKYSEHRLLAKWFPEFSNYNQSHPFSNNANTAIKKSLWIDQPYDETLTGLEDLDWAAKILKKGHKVVYEAEAVIVHIHEETPKKILNRYYREAIAYKKIFPFAKFGLWDFFYLSISNIISDYYFSIVDRVFLKNIFDIPMFRILQFYGTLKGYRHSGNIDNYLRTKFYYPTNFFKRQTPQKITAPKIHYSELHGNY